MDNTPRDFIFILPHLKVNTTSVSRFTSIIREAAQQGHHVSVLEFLYPLKKSKGLGQQLDDKVELEDYILDNLVSIPLKLNFLQKTAFFLLNQFDKPYWKILNWLHQIIFNNDIFYPGKPVKKKSFINNSLETIVVVFGGPFGIFSYAEEVSELYNAKLVLDYRDPWTFGYVSLDSSPLIHKLKMSVIRKREKRILEKAVLVTTVSKTLKYFFPQEYQYKIEVFENGTNYNLNDLKGQSNKESFNIVYLGTIYNSQLQDNIFFEAFKVFVKDKNPDEVKWYIVGAVDNYNLINKINAYDLGAYVEITPRINQDKLLVYLQNASVFLHLRYGQEKGIITSKQADYLFFNKPILLPVSDCGDISVSITMNKAGYTCNSVIENYQVLQNLWEKFSRKEDVSVNEKNSYLNLTRKEIAVRFLERLSNI